MKPLIKCAMRGLLYKTKDGKALLLHSLNPSYIADMTEAENLLSVKYCNGIAMPCHICEEKREELVSTSVTPKRCWKKVVTILRSNSHLVVPSNFKRATQRWCRYFWSIPCWSTLFLWVYKVVWTCTQFLNLSFWKMYHWESAGYLRNEYGTC